MLRLVCILTSRGLRACSLSLPLEWKPAAGQESPARGSRKTSVILPHMDMQHACGSANNRTQDSG